MALQDFTGSLVHDHRQISVQLQGAGRDSRRDGPAERLVHDLRLSLSVCQQQKTACAHDNVDAYGIGAGGHILHAVEKACVRTNGIVRQRRVHHALREHLIRPIESDMAVVADAST